MDSEISGIFRNIPEYPQYTGTYRNILDESGIVNALRGPPLQFPLCDHLGLRDATGQANRSQSHGKPETAGRQLISKQRSLLAQAHIGPNRRKVPPRALCMWHHQLGLTGVPPNLLVFGRNSSPSGLPFPSVPHETSVFMANMELFDRTA